jgi:hypothetical protein
VIPGTIPPLASVYLHQKATPLTDVASDDVDEEEIEDMAVDARTGPLVGAGSGPLVGAGSGPLAAEEALFGGQTCLVFAGPGAGKSSLLRTRLAAGVERWLSGNVDARVPVLVSASALTDLPLAQALATAVNTDLAAYGLIEELPPGFFADRPQSRAGWLILVDGLDEVADSRARQRVLNKLAAVSTREHSALYRFIVATRPLPDGELDLLDKGVPQHHVVPRYELKPFDHEDLKGVAISWFRALGLPNPGQTADQFTRLSTGRGRSTWPVFR